MMAPIVAATGSEAPHIATFEFASGSLATGTWEGTCVGRGALFDDHFPARFDFHSLGGILEEYTTEWNATAVNPHNGNGMIVPLNAHQTQTKRVVASGDGRVSWNSTGKGRIFGEHWPLPDSPLTVAPFEIRFTAKHVRTMLPANGFEQGEYYVQKGNTLWTYHGSITGWNRFADFDGRVHLHGNLSIYLESATVVSPGFEMTLPPRRENATTIGNDLVAYWRVRLHDAILRLQDAEVSFDGRLPQFICGGLRAQAVGSIVAYDAQGEIQARDRSLNFTRRELSLAGSFHYREEPVDVGPNSTGRIAAEARGSFSAAELDFLPAIPANPMRLALPLTLWSLVAAGLGAVLVQLYRLGWGINSLFTRLQRESILDQGTRNILTETLTQNPWATLAEIQRLTRFGRSTIRYHLRVLSHHGLVQARLVRGVPRFAVHVGTEVDGNPLERIITSRVREGPQRLGTLVREVMTAQGYSRYGAEKAVHRIAASYALEVRRTGREVWIWPTQDRT